MEEVKKAKVFCDECDSEIQISKVTVAEEKIEIHKLDKEATFRFIYLQCPECGHIYPIALDDKRTLYYLEKARKSRNTENRAKTANQLKKARHELASQWVNGTYKLADRVYVFDGLCSKDVEIS